MEKQELQPGFIGISYGSLTSNAIIWGADREFYFYPTDHCQSCDLEDWQIERASGETAYNLRHELYDIFGHDMSDDDVVMFIEGKSIDQALT